jgi:hypothetical protein
VSRRWYWIGFVLSRLFVWALLALALSGALSAGVGGPLLVVLIVVVAVLAAITIAATVSLFRLLRRSSQVSEESRRRWEAAILFAAPFTLPIAYWSLVRPLRLAPDRPAA